MAHACVEMTPAELGVRQVPAPEPRPETTKPVVEATPVFDTEKSVDVALPVEDAMMNALLVKEVSPLFKEIANLPKGVEVPMPSVPLVGSWKLVEVAGNVPKRMPPMLSWLFPVADWKKMLEPRPMLLPPDVRLLAVCADPTSVLPKPLVRLNPDW